MSIDAIGSSDSLSLWELFSSSSDNSASSGQSGGKAGGGKTASSIFTELDADGDGRLTFEESGLDRDTYDSLDKDGDGVISLAELEKAVELQRSAMQTRMRLQQDEDDEEQDWFEQLLAAREKQAMANPLDQNGNVSASTWNTALTGMLQAQSGYLNGTNNQQSRSSYLTSQDYSRVASMTGSPLQASSLGVHMIA